MNMEVRLFWLRGSCMRCCEFILPLIPRARTNRHESLWIAKFTISEFLKRLTNQVWKRSYERGLQFIRWFLVVTFIAVVIATLAECQPFNHYWQVVPDPGAKCRQGKSQLVTMGTSDVITDLLIVGFPIPIILKSTMAPKR